jgi:hypothetical protein
MCWGFNMDWRILVFYPEPETTEDGNLYLRLRKIKSGCRSEWDTTKKNRKLELGVNQMWILKNYKDLYIQAMSLSSCNSIKTFDFSTLYTTIFKVYIVHVLSEISSFCFIMVSSLRMLTHSMQICLSNKSSWKPECVGVLTWIGGYVVVGVNETPLRRIGN